MILVHRGEDLCTRVRGGEKIIFLACAENPPLVCLQTEEGTKGLEHAVQETARDIRSRAS